MHLAFRAVPARGSPPSALSTPEYICRTATVTVRPTAPNRRFAPSAYERASSKIASHRLQHPEHRLGDGCQNDVIASAGENRPASVDALGRGLWAGHDGSGEVPEDP